MKKNILLLITLILLDYSISGQQVSQTDAKKLAIEVQSLLHPNEVISDRQVYEYTKNGHTLMYEVWLNNDKAVLLSGNYKCKPILATVTNNEGSLLCNRDSLPCGLAFMLDWYEEQIERAFLDVNDNATQQKWRAGAIPPTRTSGVDPLTTSKWGQNSPYNDQIPPPLIGDCEYSKVGCVAVAVGRLMYYYKHPLLLEKQVEQFDWCNMKDSLTNESPDIQKKAVSSLLAECSDKVHSIYGCHATTSFLNWGRDALRDDFKYNSNMSFEYQENHSDQWWKNEIIGQLDRGNPVPYAGATNMVGDDGHAFVCDGYNELGLFHFNWGHNGRYNSYYCELTHIFENDTNNPYDHYLCAIFYAYPDDYLALCSDILFLHNFYIPFYNVSSNNNIRPYDAVPKTLATLVSASSTYNSAWRTIPAGSRAKYTAHKEIVLTHGFTVEREAEFTAEIVPCPSCMTREVSQCDNNPISISDTDVVLDDTSEFSYNSPSIQSFMAVSSILYPNPTDGELTMNVDGEVESVVIFDVNGFPQGGWDFIAITDEWITINVQRLKAGAYILKVRHPDGNTETAKFVKK